MSNFKATGYSPCKHGCNPEICATCNCAVMKLATPKSAEHPASASSQTCDFENLQPVQVLKIDETNTNEQPDEIEDRIGVSDIVEIIEHGLGQNQGAEDLAISIVSRFARAVGYNYTNMLGQRVKIEFPTNEVIASQQPVDIKALEENLESMRQTNAALVKRLQARESQQPVEFTAYVAALPCQTKSSEDLEPGCCISCRAKVASMNKRESGKDKELLDEAFSLIHIARHAGRKLKTMYMRHEVEPRSELDALIGATERMVAWVYKKRDIEYDPPTNEIEGGN